MSFLFISLIFLLLLHGYPPRGTNSVYTHYGITNHTIETFFVKHGYPPGLKNKGKTPQPSASDVSKANNDSSVIGSSNSKTFSFTQDQQHNLLDLLQQSQPYSNHVANVIYSTPFSLTFKSSPPDGKHPNL